MLLPIPLGNDADGHEMIVDLAAMPHLLIAGTTGSGKSVGIHGIILSLLRSHTPERVKMILIDPKMVEFSAYNDIPYLLIPVVTDPVKAVAALKWAVREMEERNKNMSALGVKNIESYNAKAANMEGKFITREVQTGFDPTTGEPADEEKKIEVKPMQYIVVIVDEMLDLMQMAGKEVEAAIARLAAMARAAGIHLILSTQRPNDKVITEAIKSNIQNRIAYRVMSEIDSRVIIGEPGAEELLGRGDMLYLAKDGTLTRLRGRYVSDYEIAQMAATAKEQGKPEYIDLGTVEDIKSASVEHIKSDSSDDHLYDEAVRIVWRNAGRVSISYIQRQLGIGYLQSADLIERMQKEGKFPKSPKS